MSPPLLVALISNSTVDPSHPSVEIGSSIIWTGAPVIWNK